MNLCDKFVEPAFDSWIFSLNFMKDYYGNLIGNGGYEWILNGCNS
jgi:hypothetical protein